MPRLKQIARADADPFAQGLYQMLFGDRDPVAEPGTATGTPGTWWTVFANSTDAFRHTTEGFQFYRSKKRKLDPVLRELGQLRAGYAVGSQFVFSQHCKQAREVGLDEAKVAAIPHWQIADCYSALERAVLALADALALERGRIGDAVFDVLKAQLDDEAILELTYVTATYVMHATMSRALRLEYDDVDERVVEVPAPSGEAIDVMAMVDRP